MSDGEAAERANLVTDIRTALLAAGAFRQYIGADVKGTLAPETDRFLKALASALETANAEDIESLELPALRSIHEFTPSLLSFAASSLGARLIAENPAAVDAFRPVIDAVLKFDEDGRMAAGARAPLLGPVDAERLADYVLERVAGRVIDPESDPRENPAGGPLTAPGAAIDALGTGYGNLQQVLDVISARERKAGL